MWEHIFTKILPRLENKGSLRKVKASFWGLFRTNFTGHFRKLFLFTKSKHAPIFLSKVSVQFKNLFFVTSHINHDIFRNIM